MNSRRKKARDFVHVHEFAAPPFAALKRVRVRTYEAEGELPLVVFSAPEDPAQNVTQDVERIAAEVMLKLYPERAKKAKRNERWFRLVEHLPSRYDLSAPEHARREVFEYVEFDDYRVTVGRWQVRNAERALRKNTKAEHGVQRLTFGHPRWSRTTKEEVEREAGMTLDDTFDAPTRFLPSQDLPDVPRYPGPKPEGHENGS